MKLDSARALELVAEAIETAGVLPIVVGGRVGRYEIRREIGSGAMGAVYEGFDHELDRRVAIKRIKAPNATEQARARFLREARAVAALSHPNIVAAFAMGWHRSELFLVMEYVPGVTLRHWLRTPRTRGEVVGVMLQAATGLLAAHERGLVHRDFKPENVIVGDDGRVRVLDFGLVWSAELTSAPSTDPGPAAGTSRVTAAGKTVGTPAYMAPEQAAADAVGPAADQYALCVVLCEALCGTRPSVGSSPQRWLRAARVPKPLIRTVLTGLATRPEERFASVRDVIARLQRSRPRPHRALWLAVGATVAGLTVAGLWQGPRRCVDGATKLADAWSSDTRGRVKDAFARALPEHSGAQFSATGRALDDYAQRWAVSFAAACDARDELPAAAFDVRMMCLDTARRRMASLVSLLTQADPEIAARSLEATRHLTSPTSCDAPGTDYAPAALDRARVLLDLGKPQSALEAADAARADAVRAGSRATVAEADLVRGRAFAHLRRRVLALEAYAEAFWTASALHRDDVAAQAAARRSALLCAAEARSTDGQEWLRHAESSLRPQHPPTIVALVHQARAAVASTADRYDEEERELARAVGTLSEAFGQSDPRLVAPLLQLAELARLRSDFDAATDRFERARALYVDAYGPEHPAVADVLLGLGRTAMTREAWDDAARNFDAAQRIYAATFGPEHYRTGGVLADQAGVAFARGQFDAAESLARTSLEIAQLHASPDHVMAASPLRIIGVIATERGNLDEAERALLRAESIYLEAYGPNSSRVSSILRVLSQVYRLRSQPERAVQALRRAHAIDERVFGPDSWQATLSLANLGSALTDLGRYDEGVAALERARAVLTAIYGPDHTLVSQVLNNLGVAHVEQGSLDAAESCFRRAMTIDTRDLGPDHPRLAYYHDGLGRVALRRRRAADAVEYFERAIAARRGSGVNPNALAYSLAGLAEALRASGGDRRRAASAEREAAALTAGSQSDHPMD